MITFVELINRNKFFSFVAFVALQQRRPMANVRPFLLRRGTSNAPTGGSFKRRSLKLRRGTKEGKEIESDCNVVFEQNKKKVFI